MLWSLVRLRYKLIWAQARTTSGRIALFIGLYILGASFVLLLALGGTGAAIAGPGPLVAVLDRHGRPYHRVALQIGSNG